MILKLFTTLILTAVTAKTFYKPAIILPDTQCPPVTGSNSFNLTAYLGTWHTISVSPFFFIPPKSTCVGATYTANSEGYVDVLNFATIRGVYAPFEGAATETSQGELCVNFPAGNVEYGCDNYIVLDTDNTDYTIVWSCDQLGNAATPVLYVLNRNFEISDDELQGYYDQATQIILAADPSFPMDTVISQMNQIDQTDC